MMPFCTQFFAFRRTFFFDSFANALSYPVIYASLIEIMVFRDYIHKFDQRFAHIPTPCLMVTIVCVFCKIKVERNANCVALRRRARERVSADQRAENGCSYPFIDNFVIDEISDEGMQTSISRIGERRTQTNTNCTKTVYYMKKCRSNRVNANHRTFFHPKTQHRTFFSRFLDFTELFSCKSFKKALATNIFS